MSGPDTAFFIAVKPVKRSKVPGRANDDVENMIGFPCANLSFYFKMEAYLEVLDLWETVEEDYEVLPLPNNPTMA
ncbi:hypothetical protein CR513_52436, partial [Mucuna pruriens]